MRRGVLVSTCQCEREWKKATPLLRLTQHCGSARHEQLSSRPAPKVARDSSESTCHGGRGGAYHHEGRGYTTVWRDSSERTSLRMSFPATCAPW